MTENYQKKLDSILNNLDESKPPRLLLHSCCAPCSSYCIEYLSRFFAITVLYYNPNIDTALEYGKRACEQQRLIKEMPTKNPVDIIVCRYDNSEYENYIKGLESEVEGGQRCAKCFELRLKMVARLAKEQNFDYFTTTLTISPLKNADLINSIGYEMSEKYSIKWLPSDFKKLNGYKRSIELSREYNLYRQNYCGCIYSKNNLK